MSKYHNKKTVVDGIKFDSKREANRYSNLKMLELGGAIRSLNLQVRYDFATNGVKIGYYLADFVYWDVESGRMIVEDSKGFKTPVYCLKKKLMKALHNIDVVET